MNNIKRSGVENGEETRQLVLNLSREHGVRRNDFSGLGLNNNETPEVNNRQPTTSHHSREIRELKNEVTELKRMLKLSFEVQLDMQRSLKQEIAALIAGTWSQSASASLVSKTRPSSEGSCVICTESSVDAIFYQCGHMCACYACAQSLLDRQHNCPVCRAPIKDILRAYKVGLD
jgi:hypothetical protein